MELADFFMDLPNWVILFAFVLGVVIGYLIGSLQD